MKSLSGKNIVAAITFVATLLSTSYAHAGPRFLCIFDDQQAGTRFELNIRESSDEGTLTYKYSPIASSAVVEGQMQLTRTSATWSHFVFTGKDSIATVKASVPVELDNSSIYVELDLKLEDKMTQFIKWLDCSRVR